MMHLQHTHPHPLTSTDNFFPKVNRKGCISISGSFWKQLGLAWCWECRRVHHLADAPCFSEEQSMKSTTVSKPGSAQFPSSPWMLNTPSSSTESLEHAFTRKAIKPKRFSQPRVRYLQSNGTSQTYAASGSTWSPWIQKDVLNHVVTRKPGPGREKWKCWEGWGKKNRDQDRATLLLCFERWDLILGLCFKATIRKELWNPNILGVSLRICIAGRIPD